ncbi:MAG: hypothetical protein AAF171_21135 [Cyanobacteria bacterium P01_A01_bin.116]
MAADPLVYQPVETPIAQFAVRLRRAGPASGASVAMMPVRRWHSPVR